MKPIRIGTRKSALALTQARTVADGLERLGERTELVEITTEGDRNRGSLAAIGGAGVFVNSLREALLDGRIDVAVHSCKDLPTTPAPGLSIVAIPARQDPRDALVSMGGKSLDDLPDKPRIGTGSPRRAAQLRLLRDDVEIHDIRGNVDTRLRMVTDGEVEAVVLARAGLARLGRLDAVTQTFDFHELIPAPAQGALAVECRAADADSADGNNTGANDPGNNADGNGANNENPTDVAANNETDPADHRLRRVLAALDDNQTRAAVTAERAVLSQLEAGCAAPVGAFAQTVHGEGADELCLHAIAVAVDGSSSVRLSIVGPPGEAEMLGRRLAADMLAGGASRLIEERVT